MWTMHGQPRAVLVVFCRRPALGSGKQRLARRLGATGALAIAGALLECALEDAAAWPGELVLAPESAANAEWARRLLTRTCRVQPQPSGNLGERVNGVDRALRALGHARLLFIGSDAPSLTLPGLLAAEAALGQSDAVLAPALDGGVTVMGGRVAWPELAALPWSEPTLGAALEACCRRAGLSVAKVPGSYDVDEPDDLPAARAALALDARPARRALHGLLASLTGAP
jgi:uncharacterized protein